MNDLPGRTPTILIVDDEPSVRQLLADILSTNFECHVASSAETALEMIDQQTFDLVITDINLGGMTGVELIPRIRELSPDTVVMMISGSGAIDSAIDAMRMGSFDYIKKPFNIGHVTVAVQRALEHQSLLVSKREHEENLHKLVEERTARLRYLEYYDVLTELPNKILFEDRLGQLIPGSDADNTIAVMLVLIDRLRAVRDAHGDNFANQILLEAVNRFITCAGQGVTIGRLEDAVFAAILPDAQLDGVIMLAERVKELIGRSFAVDRESFFVDSKIGISLFPADGSTAAELIQNARAALSRAREGKVSPIQFFTNDINKAAAARLALEVELRHALERDELEVYYQPKISVATRKIAGAEALVRWRHATRGFISPAEFIPLAEEIGLIGEISEYVLRRSLEDFQTSVAGLKIAVNLSALQLQNDDLVATVKNLLHLSSFDPRNLNLEITESSLVHSPESAMELLSELRRLGIQISIDDFGTGYSSLSSLISLPIDVLKIDQSFIRKAAVSEQDASLVKAIVDLGHSLNLQVVAEGVETEDQLSLLSDFHCDEFQGFLISPAVPIDSFVELVSVSETR